MADQTWNKTTLGNVLDTLGNIVGAGDGAGTILLSANRVRITAGFTLLIEAGVTVKMNISFTTSPFGFSVEENASGAGTLLIVGTEQEPVLITSQEASPAPGDYGQAVEIWSNNSARIPAMEADWCIFEYGAGGIVQGQTPNFGKSLILRHCTFRRISQSHISFVGASAPLRPQATLTRCVLDTCVSDRSSANSSPLVSVGTNCDMVLDHCSVSAQFSNASDTNSISLASGNGTVTFRNCLLVVDNAQNPPRLGLIGENGAGTPIIAGDWNWYINDDTGAILEDYIPGANDIAGMDPEFFDTSCVGNQDLRPNFNTGVSTADEFGSLLGALEPYGVPIPEPEPGEEDCSDNYAAYTSLACVPFICNYDYFEGAYPEDWRVELYDRKVVSPHSLVVCIQVPNRGIPLDFEFAPGVPIPVVGTDAESTTVDIGCWIQSMRPIRAERDVTFREYQGSDIDLVVLDWFGRLDPKLNPSLFYNLRWVGLRVEIGSWIQGTLQVLRHGRYFLQDITRRGENTVLRLRDWFLETLASPLRANAAGFNLAFKSKNQWVTFGHTYVDVDEDLATIESVRLVMQDEGREDSRVFKYIGSVTGDQGTGSLDSDFATNDGAIGIRVNAWIGSTVPGGVFAPGDEVQFTISNVSTGTPVNVCYGYLTRFGPCVEGIDVELLEFFAAESILPTNANVRLRHDKPVSVLEACRIAAQHGFLTLSTNARGHVVLGGFKPTLALDLVAIEDVAICSSNDLKELETENLPIYNLIRSAYSPMEEDGVTHSGLVGGTPNRWLTYPTDDLGPDFNRSAIFYEQEYPLAVDLPGFRAGQEAAVFAILQSHWIFFEGTPTAREKLKLKTKLHNLNRDLEEIVRVESRRPARESWAQIIGFGKDPLRQEIELTAIDISDIVQPDFACGYAFCDSGHYTDDCWVCW